ncbi:glycoside hydrolase family 16 protein [Xylariaceae sp. FL0662B]|nr:glycoside hydrolase family 16 protein [Xylariaceae sp. FL0662B]
MPSLLVLVRAFALLSSVLVSPAVAQLSTTCNPLNETCPADPALGMSYTVNFNSTPPSEVWNTTAGKIQYDSENGAAFTIHKRGESPTLTSNFYFFFGRTEVWMRAASGQGIISSIVWASDVLDEVDWEFFGGNHTHVATNYFGKGIQDDTNGGYHLVNGSVQDEFHNYTCEWTKEKLDWYLDGELIRTLLAKDANNTETYPQTPMKLALGIWAGGDPSLAQGTIEWAGGPTDYKEPYTMYVKSASVRDFTTGKSYTYGDRSGTWQSIKVESGNSTISDEINNGAKPAFELSQPVKSGIIAAGSVFGAALLAVLIFYYIKQRRRGQKEAALAAERDEQERVELERFKQEGRSPDTLAFDGTEYIGAKGVMTSTSYAVPESRPGSSLGPSEKTWDPTMASSGLVTAPLLRGDTTRSPGSPSPVHSPRSPIDQSPMRMGPFGPSDYGRVDNPGNPSPPGPIYRDHI